MGGEVPVGGEGEKLPIETVLEYTWGRAGATFIICISPCKGNLAVLRLITQASKGGSKENI
jgi:hypothetical protein